MWKKVGIAKKGLKMNNIQNSNVFSMNLNSRNLNQNPSFKAYNTNAILRDLKRKIIPSDAIVKEIRADMNAIKNSNNIDDILKFFKLNEVLSKIQTIKLQTNKGELELKAALLKMQFATAKPEEKKGIEESLARIENLIKEIEVALSNLKK